MGQLQSILVDKKWEPKPLPWEEPYEWRTIVGASPEWNGRDVRVMSEKGDDGRVEIVFYGSIIPVRGTVRADNLAPIEECPSGGCPICSGNSTTPSRCVAPRTILSE